MTIMEEDWSMTTEPRVNRDRINADLWIQFVMCRRQDRLESMFPNRKIDISALHRAGFESW